MAIEFKKTTSAQYGGDTTVSITVNNDGIGIDDLVLVFGDFLKAIGYSPAQVDKWASSYADDDQDYKIGGTSSEDITVGSLGVVWTDDPKYNNPLKTSSAPLQYDVYSPFYQDEDARLWAEKHSNELERQAMEEAYEEYIRHQKETDLGGS
jgi:hypothetical protein